MSPALTQGPARTETHNGILAELLARESERATGHLQRALRRAARAAFLWPEEAANLLQEGRSLTELPGIGPHLQKLLRQWIEEAATSEDIPPIRRNFLTLTQARAILTANPRWGRRYKGDLQMHSTWSDGAGTIKAMGLAAAERGYSYIAITDHSKGLKIAGGIDESQLLAQAAEVEQTETDLHQVGQPIRILRSLELNLNPAGKGDMDPAALGQLDLVVGSFHSALRTSVDQTERYLAALRNPDVHILGHPRGRIYNHRLGLTADWPRVFAEAAKLGKALEIDSYPDRQDLDWDLLQLARDADVRIAIDTDAHSPDQFMFVELGLAAAFLAGIKPKRIINFMPVKDLLEWVGHLREQAPSS